MIREYKNSGSAIGELYVRSRFFCNKKSHLRYRHVRAMQRATISAEPPRYHFSGYLDSAAE